MLFEQIGDDKRDVFGGGHKRTELWHIQIDIAKGEPAQDLFVYELIKLRKRQEKTRPFVYLTDGSDFQYIVVAMAKRIVALSVNTGVFGCGKL